MPPRAFLAQVQISKRGGHTPGLRDRGLPHSPLRETYFEFKWSNQMEGPFKNKPATGADNERSLRLTTNPSNTKTTFKPFLTIFSHCHTLNMSS